ncbi:AcrR family transcriptional regulator [Bradyrhizobium diazoefficiens]|jgi:AcrR family transcriptional regulator|uniref:Transcriptional regulatory protein n=2 Tax=Bradyrhizobium diazoefficiens TaxID=1355477 RepID=Q89V45_BRADU|nr:TetR family transcriptional regulator [Bradyrhizobium diazoefficiens]MBP1060062.1 AcrR family transcriptional regulator [Bradyrhizobium japonicum]AND86901.1 TetR family transcriptional regulator [Bradyrhizobium diazoefficiens USDA 110]AWO88345.1 TetR/AcrR family transcriptional regulator [Bradyrhizobium diazoefficiens]MBP1096667.1 AcrR family transcriptional regulator [Bradyrhizobium japonicum]MBR0866370.1 TetR family transcriptional regulator [Bradyrhizobium diazoefficiens]
MDNATRSERSRNAALEAAIAIIARDGPGRLTLDAIARESGLSKGGVMHQFRTKEAVLKALLERQMAHFEEFSIRYMAKVSGTSANPNLATQLATIREAATSPNSAALALVAAMVENPDLMALPRELEMKRMAAIKEEAADPDLAMLRWAGALGLLLSSLFGMSPLSKDEHQRLFARLLDDAQWTGLGQPATTRTKSAAKSTAKSGTPSAAKAPTPRKRA